MADFDPYRPPRDDPQASSENGGEPLYTVQHVMLARLPVRDAGARQAVSLLPFLVAGFAIGWLFPEWVS